MDLIIKLKNTNEIRERVLFKNLNTDHNFAELLVDVKNPLNNKVYKNAKCFIDTGATMTLVSTKILTDLEYDLDNCKTHKQFTAQNEVDVKKVPNVSLRLTELMEENDFIDLFFVNNCDINNYDIAIGGDILEKCEFIYNGHSKTFLLKLIRIE
jgi:hypothetical protein